MRRIRRRLGSADSDRRWLVWAARFGYAACGFIYIAIGLVAVAVALGLGEETASSHGVMAFLARQPFAPLLLVTLGIGLAGYAALNITGAISDPERRGVSLTALVLRAIDISTGALYIALAFAALGFLVGSTDSTDTAEAFAKKLLNFRLGRAILGLGGFGLVVSSVYLFARALTEEFGEWLDKRELSKKTRRLIELAARIGTAARGVIFGICGIFAIQTALTRSSRKISGVDEALESVGRLTLGPILLVLIGAGFIAYGVYQLSKARYQRVVVSA